MKRFWSVLPWLFLALFAIEIVVVMLPKQEKEIHIREFGRLPVLLNGRIQPFDSVARNSLLQIRSTGDVPLEEVPSWMFWKHPKKIKASEWLLEVMLKPELADTRPIFLIHHPDLLAELKLADKGVEKSGLRYYTYEQLRPVDKKIREEGQKISEMKAEVRTPFQRQALKLANAVVLYARLKNSLRPEVSEDYARELAEFQKAIGPGIEAAQLSQQGKDHDKQALERLMEPLQRFDIVGRMALPLIVPPMKPEAGRDGWLNAGTSLMESARSGEIHPAMTYYARMATAFRTGQVAEFNQALASYREWLGQGFATEVGKGRAEFYFNDVKPFLHSTIIYISALVLGGVGLMLFSLAPAASESLRRSAFYLILLAGLVHTFGLVFRMVLEGRPPVTNLYSSAVFIGWGAVILGVFLEMTYRVGIGNLVGSIAGFVTLLIAHNLALGGDTMEMMRAVLDTNFWLATHVVVVTLGYSATFVAGLLAILYIVLGVFTPVVSHELGRGGIVAAGGKAGAATGGVTVGKALSKMVYGIVCFATLFSFVGTILGGIWADQSWGRFWGWDPKENGALLIVIWNALILHARWGGLVRDRGLMNLAIFGNIITAWSWFGTNMLGIGLHSYGFMDAAFKWLMAFFISQAVFMILGGLPLHVWRSFRGAPPESGGSGSAGTPGGASSGPGTAAPSGAQA
jgi:ABC-type transport system involved in cytochrome c biogenesis permease subunit